MSKNVTLGERKKEFPMLSKMMHGKPLIYFDTAATAQKPKLVIDAMDDFYRNHYGTVHRAIYELSVESTKLYQDTRSKLKEFINASRTEEIIYTRGTTESINTVAYSFGKAFINPGDEVIISETEHHSNIVPWQIMCEDHGAVLRIAPVNDRGEIIFDEYKKLFSPRTKLVAVAHMANSTGTIHPVKEMIAVAHEHGAKFLVDGAQWAPHGKIDVQDLDADFYVFSGHKLYGPTGIGILYGKYDLLTRMPPYQGGGDMIEEVRFEKTTYQQPPLKYEAGTPMIAEVVGIGAAVDYLNEIGLDVIRDYEHELLIYATEKMRSIEGLTIIGTAKNKGAIISFVVDGVHHLDLGTLLDFRGIAIRTGHHCAQPAMRRFNVTGTARASFGLYNTKDEIDYFVSVLPEMIKILK